MCCIGKKLALPLSSLLLVFSVAANAETCVWVDYDNSPAVTVSGRITTHHKLPKGSEQRTGDGPWLILDQPLLAGFAGNCGEQRKIAIHANADDYPQLGKWANQHVTIEGKLGSVCVRSGLPIYLHRNYNHKKGSIVNQARFICHFTGSSSATTIKSQSSSNLVQGVVGLFNARLC